MAGLGAVVVVAEPDWLVHGDVLHGTVGTPHFGGQRGGLIGWSKPLDLATATAETASRPTRHFSLLYSAAHPSLPLDCSEASERIDPSRKIFPLTTKNRIPDPSEILALEFKGEFRRSAICSVSQTIDIGWSIFLGVLRKSGVSSPPKKTVSDGEVRRRQ
jgi:hypothetical protein